MREKPVSAKFDAPGWLAGELAENPTFEALH
jgi:hypothetical protein